MHGSRCHEDSGRQLGTEWPSRMVRGGRWRSRRRKSVYGFSARFGRSPFAFGSALPARLSRPERCCSPVLYDEESWRSYFRDSALRSGAETGRGRETCRIRRMAQPLVRDHPDLASVSLDRKRSARFASRIGFVRPMGRIVLQRIRSGMQFPVETDPGQSLSSASASSISGVRLESPAKLNSFGSRRCEGREFMRARNILRLRPG